MKTKENKFVHQPWYDILCFCICMIIYDTYEFINISRDGNSILDLTRFYPDVKSYIGNINTTFDDISGNDSNTLSRELWRLLKK